ncbi:MAG: putative lipoprotein [Verrucomicrobiaceae bacterium]|nr:putative lipoprotein [Verrucomicrobiaceae bacterium]
MMQGYALKIVFVVIFFLFIFCTMVSADSLRCGTSLVEVGDTKAEVEGKCGAPSSTDSYCRNEYIQNKFGIESVCHPVDLWLFNFGSGTFLNKLEFEEGKLSNIAHGDRVK